jgi:hypothetical protein
VVILQSQTSKCSALNEVGKGRIDCILILEQKSTMTDRFQDIFSSSGFQRRQHFHITVEL